MSFYRTVVKNSQKSFVEKVVFYHLKELYDVQGSCIYCYVSCLSLKIVVVPSFFSAFFFFVVHSSTDAIAALCFVLQQFQPRRWKHRFSYPRSTNSAWCGKTSVVLTAVKQRGCSWHTGRSHSTQASVWTTGKYEGFASCNFAGLVTACSWDKSETERGPEHICRINTQGSSLVLISAWNT